MRLRRLARALAFAGACWWTAGGAEALTVSVRGPERIISDQAAGACDASDLPDAPARAFRRDDGELVLFAPNFRNRAFVGPTIERLAKDCRVRFAAAGSPDPARLDDRSWLHAFHTIDGRNVFALASASFIPYRHGQACAAGKRRTDCWRNGLVALRSTDGGASFTYIGKPPRHIVFAPPAEYRADEADPPGFVSATNLVEWNGALYTVLWRRGASAKESRNCLARAPAGDTRRWELWDGQEFRPAADLGGDGWIVRTSECAMVGPRGLPAIRAILRHPESGSFIAVFQTRRNVAGRQEHGFFYATSVDLIHWSEPELLLPVDLRADSGEGEPFALYPSLIDETSKDRDLGTVGGEARLLFVRVRKDGRRTLRQLVALPVVIRN